MSPRARRPCSDRYPGQSRSPSWNPAGSRIAYTGVVEGDADVSVISVDGATGRRLTRAPGFDGRPDWSPDGRRLAFVSNRGGSQRVWLMRADGSRQRPLGLSVAGDDTPAWAVVEEGISPARGTLLPDLDQQAPSGILVLRAGSRLKLGFTSAIDNIGDGPIHIRGIRSGLDRTMRADQLIHRVDGAKRVVHEVGRLAYEAHPPHHHWHLEPYETYELYRASDGTFVGRDRKSGFCLLDRWGHAAPRAGLVPGPPRFVGELRRRRSRRPVGRRGLVGGLHRPVPGLLPRPGHRHHISFPRPLRPRAPGEPRAADTRASLFQQRRLGVGQDLGRRCSHGGTDRDDRASLPRLRHLQGRLRW